MDSVRPAYRPPAPPTVHRHPTFTYWRRRITLVVLIVVVCVGGYLAITLGLALLNQSYGPSQTSRIAAWGEAHGFGSIVSWAERTDYRWHPPAIGGKPAKGSFGTGAAAPRISNVGHLAQPLTLLSPAGVSLRGEGVWHVVGSKTALGIPTEYEAFVRPDDVHTSYVDGVVWMDTTLLSAQLYAGSAIPGKGAYFYAPPVRASKSANLVAAFDAGFPLSTSQGGYYTQGRVVEPLKNGAASMVTYKDGTVIVGKWGRDAVMSNQIESVRQNLSLIVDNGQVVNGLYTDKGKKWNNTLAASDNVWRSGVGITRDGALLYVAGPGLSLHDLAVIFVEARALRAMELNVGPDWVQFSSFQGPLNQAVTAANGTSLLSTMAGTPSRYFASWWTHDFFTMTLRPDQTTTTTTTTTTTPG